MSITIASARPCAAQHLLRASHALMEQMFPAASNHYLGLEALEEPDVHFLTATDAGAVKGCVACKDMDTYGEVKSLFVDPTARGLGIGEALLNQMIADARTRGVSLLRLETGNTLHASHRLYQRMGFTIRGPFGTYPNDPLSVFMERAI